MTQQTKQQQEREAEKEALFAKLAAILVHEVHEETLERNNAALEDGERPGCVHLDVMDEMLDGGWLEDIDGELISRIRDILQKDAEKACQPKN